jgi:hypothetical protein
MGNGSPLWSIFNQVQGLQRESIIRRKDGHHAGKLIAGKLIIDDFS